MRRNTRDTGDPRQNTKSLYSYRVEDKDRNVLSDQALLLPLCGWTSLHVPKEPPSGAGPHLVSSSHKRPTDHRVLPWSA